MNRIVTGIKPTGRPHVGNYLGMIEPSLALAQTAEAVYFVADYQALTTERRPQVLTDLTYEVTATWLALGLDPERVVLYRQSDLPEVCELAWILGCVTAKGLLNRGHAYKRALDDNRASGRPDDDGISVGVYGYPLLMAADILIHGADLVPVGQDQQQHIEVARDVAQAFNAAYGPTFRVPAGLTDETVAVIPGTDGRKMSKSYDNVVPLFADRDVVAGCIMGIVTDSRRPDEPKVPESCNVFSLYRHVASADEVERLADRYRSGSVGYREAKELLLDAHQRRFAVTADRFNELCADRPQLEAVLSDGADGARASAAGYLTAARQAVGLRSAPGWRRSMTSN